MTGGAGFIGLHLVERLLREGASVVVIDDLSTGKARPLHNLKSCGGLSFIEGNLLDAALTRKCLSGVEVVFHLASSVNTRAGLSDTSQDYRRNLLATYTLLEAMRTTDSRRIIFASTSTVYGEAKVRPTPESYGPCKPISLYGGSKLACEAFISAYSHSFGLSSVVLRLANIVGGGTNHGVAYDFYTNLKKDPKRLRILGDGTQKKSYLHVADCIDAFILALPQHASDMEIYNVGSEDQIDVQSVAGIVSQEMSLKDVEYLFDKSAADGRGWRGDVKDMLLDVTKMKTRGWSAKWSSSDATRQAVRSFMASEEDLA